MIILFEDGPLRSNMTKKCGFDGTIIDAQWGVSICKKRLDRYLSSPTAVIYTNSPVALDAKYHWSLAYNKSNLFLFSTLAKEWIPLQKCTPRRLKPELNYPRLYIAGEFDADRMRL